MDELELALRGLADAVKGGPGSGFFGHTGRPGKVGGSAAGAGGKPAAGESEGVLKWRAEQAANAQAETALEAVAAHWNDKQPVFKGAWALPPLTPDYRGGKSRITGDYEYQDASGHNLTLSFRSGTSYRTTSNRIRLPSKTHYEVTVHIRAYNPTTRGHAETRLFAKSATGESAESSQKIAAAEAAIAAKVKAKFGIDPLMWG